MAAVDSDNLETLYLAGDSARVAKYLSSNLDQVRSQYTSASGSTNSAQRTRLLKIIYISLSAVGISPLVFLLICQHLDSTEYHLDEVFKRAEEVADLSTQFIEDFCIAVFDDDLYQALTVYAKA